MVLQGLTEIPESGHTVYTGRAATPPVTFTDNAKGPLQSTGANFTAIGADPHRLKPRRGDRFVYPPL